MDGEINFIGKPGVQEALFSKGGGAAIILSCGTGHNLEIVSYQALIVCDGTVVTRSLSLSVKNSAGVAIMTPFNATFVASDNKAYAGGITQAGGAYNAVTDWHEMVVPSGGSFAASEAAFVAGDTWSIRVLYRDIPVDLMQ